MGGRGFFLALALEKLEADDSGSPGLLGIGDPRNTKEEHITLHYMHLVTGKHACDCKPFVKELCTALLAISPLYFVSLELPKRPSIVA